MQLDKFEQPLTEYLEAITLTATQAAQIDTALEGVLSLALSVFPDAEVYAQGSFATDTLAKPLTAKQGGGKAGEYDVDVAIEREVWDDAVDALNDVADAVEDDETFGRLTIDRTKNSCVRIQYAEDRTGVAFHVDLVPTKVEDGKRFVPNRESGDWKSSDAKQFAEWFNDEAEKRPGLRQVAVILKRMRDLADMTDEIKSIFVLTLVTLTYEENGTIMGDLVSVLDGIANDLLASATAPQINNPVNEGEDLAARLTDYGAVRSFFTDAHSALSDALSEDDASGLKDVFGPGFNYTPAATHNYAGTAAAIAVQPARAFGVANGTLDD